jgi:Uri superfamily endonuclease
MDRRRIQTASADQALAGALEPRPGTYALLIPLAAAAVVQVGRLGTIRLAPGLYIYVGSALGPGGLRARVAHHASPLCAKPHWHIDYLRPAAPLTRVILTYSTLRLEHAWAAALASLTGSRIPIARFGSSDCACPAHLVHFPRPPGLRRLTAALHAACGADLQVCARPPGRANF